MRHYQAILIGTDGSPAAESAVVVGGDIASRLNLPITVLTAYKEGTFLPGTDDQWALSVGDSAVAVLAERGVETPITRIAEAGNAATALLAAAEATPDTLLVVGGEGLASSKARLTASTANQISHHSLGDVVFTRKVPKRWTTIGLATDGSESSMIAVRHGYDLAVALGVKPFLVIAAKTVDDGANTLIDVEGHLNVTDPDLFGHDVITGVPAAEALCNAAWKYDLVVIGNRGMSGPARLLGSVANKVTHDIETNLLLVNTTHTADET
ncbi:hypothetical protein GCM10011591_05100 [Nocardia camponoti]|uniref:UspA domain-containing protein n=2 Tax=Nocardia camponoti TaxID=1616106 RepID=A0A917Q8Y6_9NOCA|nr:hypothetical protein GCM10011591_05100 [Nocardia camponoti]